MMKKIIRGNRTCDSRDRIGGSRPRSEQDNKSGRAQAPVPRGRQAVAGLLQHLSQRAAGLEKAPYEWDSIMMHMRTLGNFPPDDAKAILEYLKAAVESD